ncbi:methyl-accepting chemotaxis protein [Halomicrococcus gelatinilyticus]|uniref:methyl-accepting chemotaxis protein n=1 Tax=Halomicrococcus gelatinilyticus TaxID=1702103 RepID=UPI002E113DB5
MSRRLRRLLPRRLRQSYAATFALTLAALVVVTGAFGGYMYLHAGSVLQEDTKSELTTTSDIEADHVDAWFTRKHQRYETLPKSVAFPNDNYKQISTLLTDAVQQSDHVEGMYYVDRTTGDVVLDSGSPVPVTAEGTLRKAVGQRVSAAASEEVNSSGAFRLSTDGSPFVVFVAPVPAYEHRSLVALVNVESLSGALLDDVEGEVVVVDGTGRTVMATDNRSLLTRDGLGVTYGSSKGFTTANGSAVGYAPLESRDWTVTTRLPTSEAFALQSDISTQILALVALTLLCAGLVGLTIGRGTVGAVRDLSASAERLRDGDLDDPIETDREDEIGDLFRAFDAMRRSLRDEIREAERAREQAEDAREEAERSRLDAEQAQERTERAQRDAERAREEAERLNDHLIDRASEYGDVMAACAEGDLTRRMDPDAQVEALAAVAHSFNAMMDELERTVGATRAFAATADEASDAAAERVAAAAEASETVSESVAEISAGTDEQDRNLQRVAAEMEDLSSTVEEVAVSADEVADRAERAVEVGADGREAARDALAELDAIEERTEEAVARIEHLDETVAEIEDVVGLIAEVAQETDTIALNASIEAARAEEGGEGFAVVAEEVKSLAEEATSAADGVEEQIAAVRRRTDETVDAMHETRQRVADGSDAISGALSSLSAIEDEIADTNAGVQQIDAATDDGAESAAEVVAMAEDVAEIAAEMTDASERADAVADEQTETLAAVSETVADLSGRTELLRDRLATFEVRDGRETTGDEGGETASRSLSKG